MAVSARLIPLGVSMFIRLMKRREFIVGLGAAAWPLVARAQSAMPVVGVLGSGSAVGYSERLALIRQGLAEAGLMEGRTVALEYRWAEGQLDRLPALAVDLVNDKVKVIIATGGLQAPRAAMLATTTIPIVFSTDGDPVKQGLVSSLNRPGGNATGVTIFSGSLTAKRLDILHELLPKARIVGVLVNPAAAQAPEQIQDAEQAVRSLGLEIRVLNARTDAEFEPALIAIKGIPDGALLISSDPLFVAGRDKLIAAVNRNSIPAIYGRKEFAATGGLVSYGANLEEPYQLIGAYVGRILKGERVTDLPVAQPSKFELVINLRTAKSISLEIPPELLARADEVIE
jgi:putative ABC transport system substrate-binding protein